MAIYLRDNSDPYRAFVEEDFNRVDEKEGELNNLNLGLGLLGAAVAGAAATPLVRSLLKNRIRKESPVQASVPSSTSSDVPDRVYNPQKTRTELWDKLATVVPQTALRPETYAVSQRAPSTWKNVNLAKSIYPIEMNPPSESLGGLVQQRSNPSDYFHPTGPAVKMADPVTRLLQDIGDEITEEALDRAALDEAIYKEHQAAVHYAGNAILANIEKERADEMLANFHGKRRTLVNSQAVENSKIASQAVEAVGSSEDQVTGRVLRSIQRDEDRDLSAVSSDVFESRRLELADEGLLPSEIEKKLAREIAVKHAAELYASTGDPAVLQLIADTPSLPINIKTQLQVENVINPADFLGKFVTRGSGSSLPTKNLFTPVTKNVTQIDPRTGQKIVKNEIQGRAPTKLNRIQGIISRHEQYSMTLRRALVDMPETIVNPEYLALEEQTNMALASFEMTGDETSRRIYETNKSRFRSGKVPPKIIDNPEAAALTEQLIGTENILKEAKQTGAILATEQSDYPILQTLVSNQRRGENTRTFAEVNPETGKIIKETVEVRSPYLSKLLDPKTKEGRGSSAYQPDEGGLSSTGPYGIERSTYTARLDSPEMSIPPSASPSAYRQPAGSDKTSLNLVVSGGREYTNYPEFSQKMDSIISDLNVPTEKINIIAGGAKGADALAEQYAKERGLGLQVFPANWDSAENQLQAKQTGRNPAGLKRNIEMANAGDILVSFPGGTGTEHMASVMAGSQGKPVYRTGDITEATPERRLLVRQSEIIKRLSDPTWLTNAGVDLNKTTPQEQVQRYLRSQGIEQTPSPQIRVINENIDLSGAPAQPLRISVEDLQENIPTSIHSANLALNPNYPEQMTLPGVTGYDARQRPTAADFLAEELESYMSKYQGGRSSPLTSEIGPFQPTLF